MPNLTSIDMINLAQFGTTAPSPSQLSSISNPTQFYGNTGGGTSETQLQQSILSPVAYEATYGTSPSISSVEKAQEYKQAQLTSPINQTLMMGNRWAEKNQAGFRFITAQDTPVNTLNTEALNVGDSQVRIMRVHEPTGTAYTGGGGSLDTGNGTNWGLIAAIGLGAWLLMKK